MNQLIWPPNDHIKIVIIVTIEARVWRVVHGSFEEFVDSLSIVVSFLTNLASK